MEEIIIVIKVKYYGRYLFGKHEVVYARSFNVPQAVYLALLTGGEEAIKSYYRSNGDLEDDEHIISATMTLAPIIERGQKLHIGDISQDTTYLLTSSGNVSGTRQFDPSSRQGIKTLDLSHIRRFPKELIKTTYGFTTPNNLEEIESRTYEAVYAAYEDGSYQKIETYQV